MTVYTFNILTYLPKWPVEAVTDLADSKEWKADCVNLYKDERKDLLTLFGRESNFDHSITKSANLHHHTSIIFSVLLQFKFDDVMCLLIIILLIIVCDLFTVRTCICLFTELTVHPDAVQDFKSQLVNSRTVVLEWKPPTRPGVNSYQVSCR